jgi:EpsI family protein
MLKRGPVLASLGCLAALAAYMLLYPPQKISGTQLDSCPMELAGYPGTVLGLDQAVLDDLDPDDYLLRRYDRPDGLPIWVVIIYFQNARLGAHDPELCYRSQGYQVTRVAPLAVATARGPLTYHSFLARKGPRDELVRVFWYTAGGRTLDEVKGWRDSMFFQGLKSNRSFGAFVRISTLEGDDPRAAKEALDRVMQDLAPRLPGFFPEK